MTIDKKKLKPLLWSVVASWRAGDQNLQRHTDTLDVFLGERTVEEVALELLDEISQLTAGCAPPRDSYRRWPMVDLNSMSQAARSAAMRGGMDGWGQVGGLPGQIRYHEPVDAKSRRGCGCGCRRRATHRGMANGVCLTMGCDLSMRRWVKEGDRG